MNIPTVDLAEFVNGSELDKQRFVSQLGRAYEEIGFVAVKNHGVDAELIKELYVVVQEFFSLPVVQKRGYDDPELAGQRGYTSFGKEHAKGSEAPDLKEFYQYGQVPTDNVDSLEYPPNVPVREIPGFNEIFESVYRAFEKSGAILLRAIAIYLDLEEDYFDRYIKNGNSILRAIHYPPITEEPRSAIRAEQHEDINLITLLVGASADGLQVLNRKQEWIAVTSLPDQIVVNVGDMLQRLTNNKLKSTTHRVVNPPMELWHTSRFSIPFFMHPVSSMSLRCLDNCINEDHPKQYMDITAGEYLDERLREIGLKK